MSHAVLALLSRTEAAPAILADAERLSVLLNDAQIEAMAVRIDPISPVLVVRDKMPEDAEKTLRIQEAEHESAVRHVFDLWARKHVGHHQPRWIDDEGISESLIKTWGDRADYIVVGRFDAYAGHAVRDAMRGALHASLFTSRRPVLMRPPQAKATFGKTIAVAWRNDEFSLRALQAMLQLAQDPKHLHLFIGHRSDDTPTETPPILNTHNVRATRHHLLLNGKPFGHRLLAAAHDVKADLLVIGAFVRDPWRNLLFGGLTDYVLSHWDMPVLMSH